MLNRFIWEYFSTEDTPFECQSMIPVTKLENRIKEKKERRKQSMGHNVFVVIVVVAVS